MATNPPITIGPFTNVPAPGSGVKSDWAQQITNYVLRTAWTAPTFQNGWVNFSAAYQGARYRKVGDVVEIEGLIMSGTLAAPMFTLPAGFRPPLNMQFATTSGNLFAAFSVFSATGFVQAINGVNSSYQINCRFSTT